MVIYYLVINPLTIQGKKTQTVVTSNTQLSVVRGAFRNLKLYPKETNLSVESRKKPITISKVLRLAHGI